MLLPTPPGCVSSTTVCVSSGGCVSSDNVNGVPITAGHASEPDNTLPLVAVFRRPVLIPGTMGSSKSGGETSTDSGLGMNTLSSNHLLQPESPMSRKAPSGHYHQAFDQKHAHQIPQPQQHQQQHQQSEMENDLSQTQVTQSSPKPIPEKRKGAGSSSEKVLDVKTLRRLAQNREAAKKSRLRKKVANLTVPFMVFQHCLVVAISGAVEYKLFVGSLNKQATEKEVEEIFSPYGRVEDVYLMRDEMKQSRGVALHLGAQVLVLDSNHQDLEYGATLNAGMQGFGSQLLPRSGDLAMPSTLQTVWASDNELTGSIPEFIGNWSKLKSLIKDGNAERIGGSLTTG
ncbi:Flowering time control protein FCA [Camellia lanceoleosa]|uniref:Flowering time control protein FCA n=1 Tax=Camellia lanceoleosa TaxID=1840588 RepID=A0ACC0HHV7_9ERIC|nr:Flowering time control protein FCA [Camellia lanceoleosa]